MKEITGLEARSSRELPREELATSRALDDARRVSQHAMERRMGAQDGGQECAIAAADVGQRLPAVRTRKSRRSPEADSAEIAVIASSKTRSASGSARKYSKAPLPRTFSRAGMPVSSEYRNSVNGEK